MYGTGGGAGVVIVALAGFASGQSNVRTSGRVVDPGLAAGPASKLRDLHKPTYYGIMPEDGGLRSRLLADDSPFRH
jgi:hypothetical protein